MCGHCSFIYKATEAYFKERFICSAHQRMREKEQKWAFLPNEP
jgi:hypothetical protein